jgi:nitrogen fixation-related uncharacterized protein
MKNLYYVVLPAFVLAAACGGDNKSGEKKNESDFLSFKPVKGEKKQMIYDFAFETPSEKSGIGFTCELELEVKSTEKGKHEIAVSYNKICARGNYSGIGVNLCTGDTVPSALMRVVTPVFGFFKSVYNMQFDDRMRKLGEVLVSSDTSSGLANAVSKMQFFTVLPDSTVSVGGTWEEELDWSSANQKKAKLTYTYNQQKNGKAYFSFTGQMKTEGEGFGQAFSMRTTLLEGKIEVDIKTGWTVNAEMRQEVMMKVGENPEEKAVYTYKMTVK